MVWLIGTEVAPWKFESPLYTAVILTCTPTDSTEVVQVADPALIGEVPRVSEPSMKVIVPVA
jgi:hypothetical protein